MSEGVTTIDRFYCSYEVSCVTIIFLHCSVLYYMVLTVKDVLTLYIKQFFKLSDECLEHAGSVNEFDRVMQKC